MEGLLNFLKARWAATGVAYAALLFALEGAAAAAPATLSALAQPLGWSESFLHWAARAALFPPALGLGHLFVSATARRGALERLCARYETVVEKLKAQGQLARPVPVSQVIRLLPAPPTIVQHSDRTTEHERLADHFSDDFDVDAGLLRDAPKLLQDDDHLLIQDEPWAVEADTSWLAPKAKIERLDGLFAHFHSIAELTRLSRTPENKWAGLARLSGNALVVCRAKKSLILHFRAQKDDYGKHYHIFGGNYESRDVLRIASTAEREAREESGLSIDASRAPWLAMREGKRNWHMLVALGVDIDAAQFDAIDRGLKDQTWRTRYNVDEGDPVIVPMAQLEALLLEQPIVPTGWQAILVWLMCGAPANGAPGLMSPAACDRIVRAALDRGPVFKPLEN